MPKKAFMMACIHDYKRHSKNKQYLIAISLMRKNSKTWELLENIYFEKKQRTIKKIIDLY